MHENELPHAETGVWQHFYKISKLEAKCLINSCNRIIKTKDANTTGLAKHSKADGISLTKK